MAQAFPVLLIRRAEGEVRWMEVHDRLKLTSENGKKPVKQIVFAGRAIQRDGRPAMAREDTQGADE